MWKTIWDLSEFTGIGLRKLAPFVFERMIGIKGHRIDKAPIWQLTEQEYDKRSPPVLKMQFIDDILYEEKINSDEWQPVGYIPTPKTRIGWFMYHLIHGIWMRYPIHKVVLYSLFHTNPEGNK